MEKSQKRVATIERAVAIQAMASARVPTETLMLYGSRRVCRAPVSVEKRIVVVRAARKVKIVEICEDGLAMALLWRILGETHDSHDPSAQASPATADGQQTDHNGDQSRPEGDLVRDEVPLSDAPVDLHGSRSAVS